MRTNFNRYCEIKTLKKAALAAMYDRGSFSTAIIYNDKKPVEAKEKAARVLHYFKIEAAREILNKIAVGGLDSLIAPL